MKSFFAIVYLGSDGEQYCFTSCEFFNNNSEAFAHFNHFIGAPILYYFRVKLK